MKYTTTLAHFSEISYSVTVRWPRPDRQSTQAASRLVHSRLDTVRDWGGIIIKNIKNHLEISSFSLKKYNCFLFTWHEIYPSLLWTEGTLELKDASKYRMRYLEADAKPAAAKV